MSVKEDFHLLEDSSARYRIQFKHSNTSRCLKQTYRLSRFYYSDNDTKILKYSRTYELGKPMVQVREEYLNCLKICESPDCESKNYMVYGYQYENSDKDYARIRLHPLEMTYEATPVSNRFK